jgi:hypothetical protein
MENQKPNCPKDNLISLLLALEDFENLSHEPGTDEKKKISKTLSRRLRRMMYKELFLQYGENQRIAARLFQYGDNKEDIAYGLRNHILSCRQCSAEYREIRRECHDYGLGFGFMD